MVVVLRVQSHFIVLVAHWIAVNAILVCRLVQNLRQLLVVYPRMRPHSLTHITVHMVVVLDRLVVVLSVIVTRRRVLHHDWSTRIDFLTWQNLALNLGCRSGILLTMTAESLARNYLLILSRAACPVATGKSLLEI